MLRILFLHGFTSSGSCEIAEALKSEMAGIAEIVSLTSLCVRSRQWICFRGYAKESGSI